MSQSNLNPQNVVRNKNSSFAVNKSQKQPSDNDVHTDENLEDDVSQGSQESFSDEEDDDYVTPTNNNEIANLRKQLKNNIQIQELENNSNQIIGTSTEKTQTSSGQGNIPSHDLDERINNNCYQMAP